MSGSNDEHTITLLDSYTPSEIRTLEPGEELGHLLRLGQAFEDDKDPVEPGQVAARAICQHVDDWSIVGPPALACLELNGESFEVIARRSNPTDAAALAVCRCYVRLLEAGAEETTQSDWRGIARREALKG